MYIKISTLLMAATAGIFTIGCNNTSRQQNLPEQECAVEAIEKSDSIPDAVKQLVKAVAENDSNEFARLVSYPLQRPYPLRDIKSAEEMKSYYHKLVDDSLRNILTKSGPEKWNEYGWRGWSVDEGQYIWIDETVYDVNYISLSETKTLDSLYKIESESIPLNIRNGWRPMMCLKDPASGNVYRVDISTDNKDGVSQHYRLAIYDSQKNLKGQPAKLLEGHMESEGSVGSITLNFFEKGSDKEYVIAPESTDSPEPWLLTPEGNKVNLEKTYWHELLKALPKK